jgi:hypothetical protein
MNPSDRAMPTKLSILWKAPALLWLASCAVLLTDCQRVNNSFAVHSPSGEIASAELQLCRKSQPLLQSGSSFKGQMAIDCEGSGKIVVRLKDGRDMSCPVGYVTPGMATLFEYVIKDGACE